MTSTPLIFKALEWNSVALSCCSFQPIASKSERQVSGCQETWPPTLFSGLLTADPSWQTWSDATDLNIYISQQTLGWSQPQGAAVLSDTASILVVASWRTLASRRPRGRRCALLTHLSPFPSPSWGREAAYGKMEKSSSCPEICQVHYRPNARAPTQRKSFWLVGARMQQRSSVPYCNSTLSWGHLLLSVRTFLSLFAERCVLTQVQCSRECVRTFQDHKVTASSGPPTAERTSLFISQSEWRFTPREKTSGGGTRVISEVTQDFWCWNVSSEKNPFWRSSMMIRLHNLGFSS